MKKSSDSSQEDTVGSQSKNQCRLAYIAGFLDGDGSLMLQIKRRTDNKLKARFMAVICFYQSTRHDSTLLWIKKTLKIGYVSQRNDNITELRINGFSRCLTVLKSLRPFIKIKKIQCSYLIKACKVLADKKQNSLTKAQRRSLANCVVAIQNANYTSHKKKSIEEILQLLDLTP